MSKPWRCLYCGEPMNGKWKCGCSGSVKGDRVAIGFLIVAVPLFMSYFLFLLGGGLVTFLADTKRRRRRKIKRDYIAEIREVRRALISQGDHPHVSPVVGRWFRRQGFQITPSTRQRWHYCVWCPE